MASATDFTIGAKSGDTCPSTTRPGGSVNVQPEILQQLSSLISMCLPVHADVVNRFRKERWCTFYLDGPSRLVSDSVAVFTAASDGRARLLALDGNLSIASIEVHLGDVGVLGDDITNHITCSVHVHHGLNGGPEDNLSLDASSDFPYQSILARKGFHVFRDDGDVARFEVDFILDASWDDFCDLVFQFSVGHLHDVHLLLPQSM